MRSHAVGVGNDLPDNIVRLVMVMKIVALAEGFSGVRLKLIETLCALVNANIYPCIPEKGSVGASGDLAPLAHLAGVLIGVGEARVEGTVVPAQVALQGSGHRTAGACAERRSCVAEWHAGVYGAGVGSGVSNRERIVGGAGCWCDVIRCDQRKRHAVRQTYSERSRARRANCRGRGTCGN